MLVKDIQQLLIKQRLLDPPADGNWGRQSTAALRHFQQIAGLEPTGEASGKTIVALSEAAEPEFSLSNDFASRIIREMLRLGYWVPMGKALYSIVYVEGADAEGKSNPDIPNVWNDRRIVLEVLNGHPKILGNWTATSEPGNKYTLAPLNPKGAFRIKCPAQFKAWRVGNHKNQLALVQAAEVEGHRDGNQDFKRTGDNLVKGLYGINQHHGGNSPFVGAWSAGCLVGQSIQSHAEFMELVQSDRRYQANPNYLFYTCILPGDKLP